MELVSRAAAAALAGAILALTVKKTNPELALLIGAAAAVAVLWLCAAPAGALGELAVSLEESAGLSPAIFAPVLKCVAIGIVTRLSADLCRDAGQQSVAAAAELLGTAAALSAAVPLFQSLIQMIGGLL